MELLTYDKWGVSMTQILENIEILRRRLNQMIADNSDNIELYEISTELDSWITKYYNEQ